MASHPMAKKPFIVRTSNAGEMEGTSGRRKEEDPSEYSL